VFITERLCGRLTYICTVDCDLGAHQTY